MLIQACLVKAKEHQLQMLWILLEADNRVADNPLARILRVPGTHMMTRLVTMPVWLRSTSTGD